MSARRRVIVVGAGFGGLAAAARLRERGDDAIEIMLLTAGGRATFLAGALDVALGEADADRFSVPVALDGVRCVDATVERVAGDHVTVGDERIGADAVIAAPGLALGPVPAWPRAVAAWDPQTAARAREALPELTGGRLLVAACSLPYRCPPAPFALAIALAEQSRRARRMTRVIVATPEPFPLAGVGGEAPALIMEACAAGGVTVERGFATDLQRSEDGVLRASDGRELAYDAAFLVAPHVRPACLNELPGDGPLVPVSDRGLVPGQDGALYVVGDAAATGLPRAGGVAAAFGRSAADAVLEGLGIAAPPPPEPIEASCFMLHAGGAVSRLRVTFSGDERRVQIDGPSLDLARAREGARRRFLTEARSVANPLDPI
ncbi:MAG: NAD(P)/FAD-dependent oxidoreductase [Solirubrobacteraceae bacterium]